MLFNFLNLYIKQKGKAMELTLSTFLIVCPFAFLAGFVDSIGGGGGLISLPAYVIAGLPANTAVFTNKLSACLGTIVATARYCKNNFIDKSLALVGILTAACGGLIGARCALMVDEVIFKILLLVLLPLIAMYVLLKKDLEPKDTQTLSRNKQYIIVSIATFFLGTYVGFYGPGSGTFLILAYAGLAKMNILKAEGNAKLANMTADMCSLFIFLANGVVIIPLGLTAAAFSIAGNYIGAGVAMKNGSRVIRIVVLSVLAILFIKVIWDSGKYFINWF